MNIKPNGPAEDKYFFFLQRIKHFFKKHFYFLRKTSPHFRISFQLDIKITESETASVHSLTIEERESFFTLQITIILNSSSNMTF